MTEAKRFAAIAQAGIKAVAQPDPLPHAGHMDPEATTTVHGLNMYGRQTRCILLCPALEKQRRLRGEIDPALGRRVFARASGCCRSVLKPSLGEEQVSICRRSAIERERSNNMAGRSMLSHGIAVDPYLNNAGDLIAGQVLRILCWQFNASKHPVIQRCGQQLFTLLLHLRQERLRGPFQDALNATFWRTAAAALPRHQQVRGLDLRWARSRCVWTCPH